MVAMYILYAIPLLFVKLNRQSGINPFRNLILSILIPGICSSLALLTSAIWIAGHLRIFNTVQSRVGGQIDIIRNLQYLKSMLPDLLKNSYNLLPPYLFAGLVVILLFLILFGYKYWRFHFCQVIMILAAAGTGCIGFSILFQIFIPEPWIVARSVFAFSAIPGMLTLFYILYTKKLSETWYRRSSGYVAALAGLLLLGATMIETFRLSAALKEVQRRDSVEAEQVMRRIEQLEKIHGKRIVLIRVFHDYPYQETYPGIKYKGMASRLLAVPWKIGPYIVSAK